MAVRKKAASNGATNRITAPPAEEKVEIRIEPPNMRIIKFECVGTSPYMQNKFGTRPQREIRLKQEKGSAAEGKKKRKPKDFKAVCDDARHVSEEGWSGIPCPAFQAAMVSACRTVGFKMTHAKLGFKIIPDGYDKDGTALVKIIGRHAMDVRAVRPQINVMDLASRPIWKKWSFTLTVEYDGDMFGPEDITNLLMRAGKQVGVGAGRPDSKMSVGMGYGLFDIKQKAK